MQGLGVLVIEDEYIVAAAMEASLIAAGANDVLLARNIGDAARHASGFELAIIDARFGDPAVIAFAEKLNDAGIASVVTSADRAIMSLFTGSVPLEKPFDDATLMAACEAARAGRQATQV